MGKQKKREEMLFNQLLASINELKKPSRSEQILFEQGQGIQNWLASRDYRNVPTGLVLDFNAPAENLKRYEMLMNADQTGTAALGATGGQNRQIQQQYFKDRFARDEAANFQDNVRRAGDLGRQLLGNVAGMEQSRNLGAVSALQNAYTTQLNRPKSPSLLGSILKTAIGVGMSFVPGLQGAGLATAGQGATGLLGGGSSASGFNAFSGMGMS